MKQTISSLYKLYFVSCFVLLGCILITTIPLTQGKCTFMANNNETTPAGPPTVPRTDPIKADWLDINITETCDQFTFGQEVCCNYSQVEKLKDNWQLIEKSFYACKACQISFKRMWCGFVCSPNQGDFVDITKLKDNNQVESVNFWVTNKFGKGIWDSCQYTRMGQGPINKLFGSYRDFLRIAQSPFPPHTPSFKIKYKDYEPNAKNTGFYTDTIPCQDMCNCGSCKPVCQQAWSPESCHLFGMKCSNVGFITMGIVGGLALMAVIFSVSIRIYNWRVRKSSEEIAFIS
eukprot:gb/GECH01012642.1/.p1 GENE.gb/GECH01012642.1/~~gb/GECH01012642.1/.p1  ORF type:complete len:289 (+),score=30.02 gb/GECH01012642.1/:1-867(+)